MGDSERGLKSIGEKSSVQIGLILVLLSFLAGATWWASAMQSKLDTLIEESHGTKVLSALVQDHETRLRLLEVK